jgi:hypothetical protein
MILHGNIKIELNFIFKYILSAIADFVSLPWANITLNMQDLWPPLITPSSYSIEAVNH